MNNQVEEAGKGGRTSGPWMVGRHLLETEAKDREISALRNELAHARSELQRARAELEVERDQRDSMLASMATFNHRLAHYLKGPLTDISAAASLISLKHAHEIPNSISRKMLGAAPR